MSEISRRDALKWGMSGALLTTLGLGFGFNEADKLKVNHQELILPKWDAHGIKIGFISDIHVSRPWGAVRGRRAAEQMVKEKPDIILYGGDFVSSSDPEALEHIHSALEPLHDAKCPVYGVLGNHDYGLAQPSRVVQALHQSPMNLLRNQTVEFQGVTIAGLDDALMAMHDTSCIRPDLTSKSLITILHEPDFVTEIPGGVSLMLSGHSHGGQVCLPGGMSLYTPIGAKSYRQGFYKDAPTPLFVSAGVGTTGMDVRLFCTPEINILTLRGA